MASIIEPTLRFYESGVVGAGPGEWYGTDLPDGTRGDWAKAPLGSTYLYRASSTKAQRFFKLKNDGRNDDWINLRGALAYRITRAMMTDGGSTAGTYTVAAALPAGSYIERCLLVNVTGFTGDTSATITVGDGSDVDRLNTGTPSVFTTATAIALGVPSGTIDVTAAMDLVVTVTSAADFTSVAAGALTLVVFYRSVNL